MNGPARSAHMLHQIVAQSLAATVYGAQCNPQLFAHLKILVWYPVAAKNPQDLVCSHTSMCVQQHLC